MGYFIVSFVVGLLAGGYVSAHVAVRSSFLAFGGLVATNLLVVVAALVAFRSSPDQGGPPAVWLVLWLWGLPYVFWPLSAGLALGGLSAALMRSWFRS